jgi:hypothetical protein
MKKKIFGYVTWEINRLTKDEDMRQELWVFFLEGNSPFNFQQHLDKLQEQELKLREIFYGTEKVI